MKCAMFLLVCLCAGCSVTVSGSAKWSDTPPGGDAALQAQYDKMLTETRGFVADVRAASQDLNALHGVMKKYGIAPKGDEQRR